MVDEPVRPSVPRQTPQQQADADKAREQSRDELNKREGERRKQQDENNKKAAEVMEKSTPFPSQEQLDQAKLGTLKSDDLQAPDQPEMPPLHEQRRERDEADKRKR